MDYVADYTRKTPESARMFAESARLHVNGVSHNIRYFDPYPFVAKSSKGSTITDVDENTYTDYWMGHWSLILGHGHDAVTDALHKQLDAGWMYGTVNEQTVALSRMISDAVPVAEKIRYTASGTEAVMYATRLARSHTGRNIIAKVDGGWHGYASDMLKSVNWPFESSESAGLIGEEKIISVPYNNLDETTRILAEYKDDLAGVIIEPVLGGGGGIAASAEYLAGVQEFVHRNDSLFILDEIVTGFRLRYGCAYETMNLEPDMVTLGKIIGGGMAIGAICGLDDIMMHADTTRMTDNGMDRRRSYIGGGTFSANPASMVAGSSTLSLLRNGKSVYEKINRLGERARSGLAGVLGDAAAITGTGSLFMVHFTKDGTQNMITNAKEAALCDQDMLHRYHFKMIAQNGIFILPGKMGAISSAHTDQDVDKMIMATEEFERNENIQSVKA